MRKNRHPDKSLPPVENVSEQQLRRTQAEFRDRSGELQELDLHGQTAQQASVNVYGFLTSLADSGEPCCLVIHGKGTGTLERVVSKEIQDLTEQGIIETSFPSQKYPGAAIVVVFRV